MKYLLPICLLATSFLTGCQSYLDVQGVKYRTLASQDATLSGCGSVGYSLSGLEFIPDSSNVTFSKPLATRVKTAETDAGVRKAALSASASAAKAITTAPLSGNANFNNEDDVNGKYQVISTPDDIQAAINKPENAHVRNVLTKWGPKARFITTVCVAYNRKQVVSTKVGGSVSATYTVVNGSASVDVDNQRTITLSDGTVFAYEMARPYWKKNSKGKVVVAGVSIERPGLSNSIPPGTSFDPKTVQ